MYDCFFIKSFPNLFANDKGGEELLVIFVSLTFCRKDTHFQSFAHIPKERWSTCIGGDILGLEKQV
jgi:hypothetical protein